MACLWGAGKFPAPPEGGKKEEGSLVLAKVAPFGTAYLFRLGSLEHLDIFHVADAALALYFCELVIRFTSSQS